MKKSLTLVVLLFVPQVALSVVTFDKVGDNVFVVSHAVKGFGGRGQASALVLEKAASLCVAAGYSHLVILNEESSAGGYYEDANAQVRAAFRMSGGEELIDCKSVASQKYIGQAKRGLERINYSGPVDVGAQAAASAGTGPCTIEQVMTMTKAGFTEAQIQAACPGAG